MKQVPLQIVILAAIALDTIELLGDLYDDGYSLREGTGAWLSFSRATDPMDASARFNYNWSIAEERAKMMRL